jgi:FkbM family methyltransferase
LAIDRLLGHPASGFYVDVGAWHPRKFNNTWRFYRRGWHGINVEPDPDMCRLLAAARPRDININIAAGSSDGRRVLFKFAAGNLSTISEAESDFCIEKGFAPSDTIDVGVRTLAGLLSEHRPSGRIDFMTIDTEGLELEVLEGNDWSSFRPWLICVEIAEGYRSAGCSSDTAAIKELLERVGYLEVYRNRLNSIFVLEE